VARKFIILFGAVSLTACGQSTDNQAANQAAANAAQPKKKAAYCFFKDSETKDWSAARGKDGNIVVKGKAYRSDSRYQALLGPPTVSGTTVEVSPSIQQNSTGFGAPENWWEVTATIPGSAAVDTVKVTCGAKTLAEIKVAPKG
jgi:hypothetical protein